MLLFYCTSTDKLDQVEKEGLKGPVKLFSCFSDACEKIAESKKHDVILVVHGLKVEGKIIGKRKHKVRVDNVPLDAILNLDPYLVPEEVIAGGGYVIRDGKEEPEVLMIYRRGCWDLPKGKLDEGESFEECAVREVQEEVGIQKLKVKGDLGKTVHGYARRNKYKVKTTYWYHMQTREEEFTPQAEEDIEKVEWVPWSKALKCVGYEIFRRHMQRVEERLPALV